MVVGPEEVDLDPAFGDLDRGVEKWGGVATAWSIAFSLHPRFRI